MTSKLLLTCIAFALSSSAAFSKEVWVYTSVYKEYAEMLKTSFEAGHPGAKIQIFQAGSEKVQAKVEAELISGKLQADMVMTSDPFWTVELDKKGLLLPGPRNKTVDVNYYSLMIMAVPKSLAAGDRPRSFKDLMKDDFKHKVAMPSPLESGTAFSTVAYLSEKYGWGYFKALRTNDVLAHGGNSSVVQHLDTGERKVGIVLLENVLAAQSKGSQLEVIYPTDGGVPVPSAQAIFKGGPNPEGALEFAKFVLSDEGQKILAKGFMYSISSKVAAPANAKPFKEATKGSKIWNEQDLRKIGARQKEIKKQFQALVLE